MKAPAPVVAALEAWVLMIGLIIFNCLLRQRLVGGLAGGPAAEHAWSWTDVMWVWG